MVLVIKVRDVINMKISGMVYKIVKKVADIAQLVEQLICNQRVGSSSLSVGTSFQALLILNCHAEASSA